MIAPPARRPPAPDQPTSHRPLATRRPCLPSLDPDNPRGPINDSLTTASPIGPLCHVDRAMSPATTLPSQRPRISHIICHLSVPAKSLAHINTPPQLTRHPTPLTPCCYFMLAFASFQQPLRRRYQRPAGSPAADCYCSSSVGSFLPAFLLLASRSTSGQAFHHWASFTSASYAQPPPLPHGPTANTSACHAFAMSAVPHQAFVTSVVPHHAFSTSALPPQ